MKECDVAWFDIDSLDRPLIINPNGVIEEFVDKQPPSSETHSIYQTI